LRFLQESLLNYVLISVNTLARKRVTLIKRVIAEIAGRSPYERKIIELLKQGKGNATKKAYKMAKSRLGSHKRALKKRNELADSLTRK
jgi:large subunit ribosomal protein L36e